MTCITHGKKCHPSGHSPGGYLEGTLPFRPGKTKRDHRKGVWANRFNNRNNDPGRNGRGTER